MTPQSARYLFGPATPEFALERLSTNKENCLVLGADVPFEGCSSWQELQARFPPNWQPDFVAFWSAYMDLPRCLLDAPVPLVLLAPDSNILGHAYAHLKDWFEIVLTDEPSIPLLKSLGYSQILGANFFGPGRSWFDKAPPPQSKRDVDLCFVGNLHPAVQRARLPWLGKIARLAPRRRVVIAAGVFGEAYQKLLRQSKLVFNLSVRSEFNLRVGEACASGALLLQEVWNAEVPKYLKPGVDYGVYDGDNLEEIIDYYLSSDAARCAVASRGQEKIRECSAPVLWDRQVQQIQELLPSLQEKALARAERAKQARSDKGDPLLGAAKTWLLLGSNNQSQNQLTPVIESVMSVESLGCKAASTPDTQQALSLWEQVLGLVPNHPQALVAKTILLALTQKPKEAVQFGMQVLEQLSKEPPPPESWLRQPGPFLGFDHLRVNWERILWESKGDIQQEMGRKMQLLYWRVSDLLAQITDDPRFWRMATQAQPEIASSQAGLGCSLAQRKVLGQAIAYLKRATELDPFDAPAARALVTALDEIGDTHGSQAFKARLGKLWSACPSAAPVGPELDPNPKVSIIVPCYNLWNLTARCLTALWNHTGISAEIIVVNDGSSDETAMQLERITRAEGLPVPLKIVNLSQNQGYPKAINAGLRVAQGEWIVTLNNDAVVTPHWLSRLLRVADNVGSDCGLVGPVSNGAPPPQLLEPFPTLAELDAFADARWQQHGPRATLVQRLTGFCLLVRRDVWEQLGGLDERFGQGFFDDDDLCLRARNLGYTLAVADAVYVHHDGSQTFLSHGINTQNLLRNNLELYREKWGDAEANRYSPVTLPSQRPQQPAQPSLPSSVSTTPAKISLTMIVKNEEHYLPECLESIQGLFDEIVIVDTGSTDRTREIIAQHGAKLGEFAWVDSFSQARNAALDLATGDWVFWLDADDRVLPSERPKLEQLLNRVRMGDVQNAQVVKCRCLPIPGGNPTVVDHVRLFPKKPGVRWEYRVHEQILPSLRRAGVGTEWSEVTVTHVGYAPPEAREKKLARDLRILELDLQEKPGDPFILFNLASAHHEAGRFQQALQCAQASIQASHPSDSIVRKLYALAAQCQTRLGDVSGALNTLQQGQSIYPQDEELLFTEASLRLENRDYRGAISVYQTLLQTEDGPHFGSVVEGLRGFRTKHNLAVAYWQSGNHIQAENLWNEVIQERPNFFLACHGLSEALLARKDFLALENLASQTENYGDEGKELATIWRGRILLHQEKHSAARFHFNVGVREFPNSVEMHGLRVEACLKEGLDLIETERALQDFLKLDPNHANWRLQYAVVRAKRRMKLDFKTDLTLESLYHHTAATPSDINEHLPVLAELARVSPKIIEMGTRTGESTLALLWGSKTGQVTSYDLNRHIEVDLMAALAGNRYRFVQADVLKIEIEPCDLLFIDTLHDYDQLKQELQLHGSKARYFIVLHDTSTFGEQGETPGKRGLWPAVEEFVAEGKWEVYRRYLHNNGLTVLQRKV